MRVVTCFIILLHISMASVPAQAVPMRSFGEIFPSLPPAIREEAFTHEGFFKSYKGSFSGLIGSSQSTLEPHIINAVLNKKPGFLSESILVIPCTVDERSLLNVYNALGKVRALKGRLYHSYTRKEDIPLFEEVTRIESERRNNPVDDPPPASAIPQSETVYMRLKDVNFGNSFYRGDLTLERRGLRYSLTNYKSLSYLFVPVIREEKFTAQLYIEPISEGILIYALAGADVSDLVSSRVDIASAIGKRLAVILDWITDGITSGH